MAAGLSSGPESVNWSFESSQRWKIGGMFGDGGVELLHLLTPSRFRLSSRCRGTTVTISISHRNATSIGVNPDCKGSAIM